MTDNPYTVSDVDDHLPVLPIPRTPLSRGDAARKLLSVGLLGGATLGSIGYLILIALVETLLVPPFKSPPNYGQFIIVVIGVAFYMTMFGMALAVIPYVKWIGYIPIHLIGIFLIWAADKRFFSEVDWTEAPITVMLLLFALPTVAAIIAHSWYRSHVVELQNSIGRTK